MNRDQIQVALQNCENCKTRDQNIELGVKLITAVNLEKITKQAMTVWKMLKTYTEENQTFQIKYQKNFFKMMYSNTNEKKKWTRDSNQLIN